jgi:hypothetical protein
VSPEEIIESLSRRYGVSTGFGLRLRHLIQRALESGPEARKRILDLVERSFAHEAVLKQAREVGTPEEQMRALNAVAPVLHDWSPPEWLKRWTDQQTQPEDG